MVRYSRDWHCRISTSNSDVSKSLVTLCQRSKTHLYRHIRDLQLSVSAPFGEGIQCVIQGIGALGVAFYYSWNLTLVILCTVPLIYLVQMFISHRLSIRANEQANKLQLALKYIANTITSIETVKCFSGENYELQVFTKVTAVATSIYKRVANLRSLQIGAMQFFTLSVFVPCQDGRPRCRSSYNNVLGCSASYSRHNRVSAAINCATERKDCRRTSSATDGSDLSKRSGP
jgi:hypothetical protein